MENFVQGNDPRLNSEKPATTFQFYQTEKQMLAVYRGNNEATGLYFYGKPEHYMGGATNQPTLPEDFVGDLSRGKLEEEWSTGIKEYEKIKEEDEK